MEHIEQIKYMVETTKKRNFEISGSPWKKHKKIDYAFNLNDVAKQKTFCISF